MTEKSSSDRSEIFEEWLDEIIFHQEPLLAIPMFHFESSIHSSKPPRTLKRRNSKRPSSNPIYMPALRILKRDIRRKYGPMLMNVANSHDSDLMRRFFTDFALPSLFIQDVFPFDVKVFPRKFNRLHGVNAIVKHFGTNFLLMPDAVLRMKEIKVCQRLGSPGSRVIASVQMNGTLVHEEPQNLSLTITQFADLIPLPNPYEIYLEGTITMYLDEIHRISSMTLAVHRLREEALSSAP